jgi:uncharacterized protein (TIGR03546 family)
VQKSRDAMILFGRTPGRHAITGNFRAQFALGICLGLMIGLIPKDSLLPWVIGLFTLLLPVNLGATLIAVAIGSVLSFCMDAFAHSIGQIVLSNTTALSYLVEAFELPLFAWTRLNNTVVMGLTTIGILSAIPAYLIAHALYRDPRIPKHSTSDQSFDPSEEFPVVHTASLQES